MTTEHKERTLKLNSSNQHLLPTMTLNISFVIFKHIHFIRIQTLLCSSLTVTKYVELFIKLGHTSEDIITYVTFLIYLDIGMCYTNLRQMIWT